MKPNSLSKLLEQNKVVIPPIQRDYAQGRATSNITYIRDRFLEGIKNAFIDDSLPPVELDFIYGYEEIDNSPNKAISVFKPLDGQQRLTTLFLIHWFSAAKEGKHHEAKKMLQNFSYSTRKSSRDFCERLISFEPDFGGTSINSEIENQPWFFSTWTNDPTISSMLVMLKEIQEKFSSIQDLWPKITSENPRITFHLLSMEDLGMPDDLYIKMNARGKGLTDFEYFKSQFSEILDETSAKIFDKKIDGEWSDLFWNIFKDKPNKDIAKEVDNGFLSFFWFITDLIINRNVIEIKGEFWLDKIKEVYKGRPENVTFLFESLSLFENLERSRPNYFDELFYINSIDFKIHKTRIFFANAQTNLFRKCAEQYGFAKKKNSFSVGEQLLLYAFIYMNLEKREINNRAFRLLRNIFSSSEDQLRNEYLSTFLYRDTESLITSNCYTEESKLSIRQLDEENLKLAFLENNPTQKEVVFALEDHRLLRGHIALFDYNEDLYLYADSFHEVFREECDYFSISKAMLTFGDYTQVSGKSRRFGNHNDSVWREIFGQSHTRKEFQNTKLILGKYLKCITKNESKTDDTIIKEYSTKYEQTHCPPRDFCYYYITYSSFSCWNSYPTEGYYYWDDYTNNPYECWMLFRKQFNGRHWNPFLLALSKMDTRCTLGDYGDKLQFTNGDTILLISTVNNGFQFSTTDDDLSSKKVFEELIRLNILEDSGILVVSQNEDHKDLEDRIVKCKLLLENIKQEF